MHKANLRRIFRTFVASMILVGTIPPGAYGRTHPPKKSESKARPATEEQVLAMNKRLVEAENSKDFGSVKGMVWNSPSALFVAKTATVAEGNWAGFWGHDVVVEHLHEVIYGGPFRIDPDYSKSKAVLLSSEVAETYVPVQITVGYAGQQAVPKPFLILIDWVKTSSGWKMASDIAIPVPPPPAAAQ